MRIAILEDDEVQAALVEAIATRAGHDCHLFSNGRTLVLECARESFDLFVLDWQVPGMTGLEVLRWIRKNTGSQVPVMFVTSRDEESDIVTALGAGADDYLVKPVSPGEFLSHMGGLLRRAYPQRNAGLMEFAHYVFDTGSRRLRVDGVEMALTQKEFDLALFLFRNVGRLVSRRHVMEAVWGRAQEPASGTLEEHLSRLAAKLELSAQSGFRLATVFEFGYRLERTDAVTATPRCASGG